MYIPISRRYRPQDFDSVAGQQHITQILKNAILMNKAGYAYLFSGPQGVGKTSTARVFAKSLNCEKGPTDNPCNKCVSCEEITKGSSMDVMEIDGASNRGIDEIRNLRENVKLKPISGKFKVYIIDEVHMLTAEAFNALLKTLEEPPPHVKFIFATTRPYKILPTILSRCQRFDFHMLPMEVIVDSLKNIAAREKININEEALFMIAKNASGSMRDAQVMLDQIASYSSGKITGQAVSGMLGLMDGEMAYRTARAILEHDAGAILDALKQMTAQGKDPSFIASSLIEYFRDILVTSSCGDPGRHVIVNEEKRVKISELASEFTQDELFYIIFSLFNALDLINKTSLGKIPLEMALLKLSRKERMLPVSDLIERAERLGDISSGSPVVQPVISGPKEARQENIHEYEGADEDISEGPVEEPLADAPAVSEPIMTAVKEQAYVPDGDGALLVRIKGVWPEVTRSVKAKKMSAGIYLEEGQIVGIKGTKVIIGFNKNNSLHKEALEAKQNIDIVSVAIKEFLEKEMGVSYIFLEDTLAQSSKENGNTGVEPQAALSLSKKLEPIIKNALDKFNAKIVKQYYVKEG